MIVRCRSLSSWIASIAKSWSRSTYEPPGSGGRKRHVERHPNGHNGFWGGFRGRFCLRAWAPLGTNWEIFGANRFCHGLRASFSR